MRLFIAAPVPAELRRALARTQASLRANGARGRFAPPENLHMTLVFLGNVPDPAPVIEAMRPLRLPRTALRFDRLTLFGDVLVALYQPDNALAAYVKTLRAALDAAGLPYEKQAFRPHITLCRKTALPGEFRVSLSEQGLRTTPMRVQAATLFCSALSGEGPRYTPLHTERAKS